MAAVVLETSTREGVFGEDKSRVGSGVQQHEERITDVIKARRQQSGKPFVSIEFFPPKTPEGISGLYDVLSKLQAFNPLFADVTWGAGGSTSELTLELCKGIKDRGTLPNLHLTCTNMERSKIDDALAGCKAAGITNILALRGDPPAGQAAWTATDATLTCALDLINYIRKTYSADDFCIACAGYPEGHPSVMEPAPEGLASLSPAEQARCSVEVDEATGQEVVWVCRDAAFAKEIEYLKQKVDAGAELIVTQMFFDAEVFGEFVKTCRAAGIQVPILPGIMLVTSYAGFKRMSKFCKSRVPTALAAKLETIKDDEAAVKAFGAAFGVEMCRRLLELGAEGLHVYTLNASVAARAVLEQLRDVLDVPPMLLA